MNAFDESLAPSSERASGSGRAPPPEPVESAGPGRSIDSWLLTRLRAVLGDPPVEFAVKERALVGPAAEPAVARVTFANRRTLMPILADPPLRFGDAYSEGSVAIDGDLASLLETVYRSGLAAAKSGSLLRRATGALRRPHKNTLAGSRDNIHHHYDIGNEFYSLWLGRTMAYTCAYYPTEDATLDEAQVAKMDHVCRKLRLKAGESVVEAGCGWGRLALHMARNYGVRVRAFNISREQVAYARERAAREGLSGQVEYVEDDYRNISGRFDAFVSVGMLEHVGVENYATLGAVIRRALQGRGRGLIHSIGRNYPAPLHPWIERRIFPGAYPPSLGGDDAASSSPGIFPSSMSRICVCTTRARCVTGWSFTRMPASACGRCSMRSSCACGACTWPVPWRPSRPARCSFSRWCSPLARTTTFP